MMTNTTTTMKPILSMTHVFVKYLVVFPLLTIQWASWPTMAQALVAATATATAVSNDQPSLLRVQYPPLLYNDYQEMETEQVQSSSNTADDMVVSSRLEVLRYVQSIQAHTQR